MVLALAGALIGLRRAESPYADGDILWGARSGKDILSSGSIPRVDPYSWTAHGKAWIPNGWGWNVLLGGADQLAGLAGIAVLGIAAVSVLAILIGHTTRRAGARTSWVVLLFIIVAGVFELFLYPRAQLADYLAIFAFPLVVPTALSARGRPAFCAGTLTALVQIVWMNLHTAAVLGPVLVAALGTGVVVNTKFAGRRRAMTTRLAGMVALTAAGCLATPYGADPITHLEEVRRSSVGLISEWRPVGFGSPEQLLGMLALVLAAAAAWFAVRAGRMDTVLVLIVLAAATASAIRFAPMAALYAVPELALFAGRIHARPAFVNRICALAFAVFAVTSLNGANGFAQPGVANASPRLVAELPSGCRLLNDLGVGGAVILRRPDVPVSIDSRNDMYGRQAEVRSLEALYEPTFGLRYLYANSVTCVLAPSASPLIATLTSNKGWVSLGHDPIRTLLVRRTG